MNIEFSKELIHKFVTRVCYDVFGLNKYHIVYDYSELIGTYSEIQICTYDEDGNISPDDVSYWNVFSPLIGPINIKDSYKIDKGITSIKNVIQSEFTTLGFNNDMIFNKDVMNKLQELLSYDDNEFKLLFKLI